MSAPSDLAGALRWAEAELADAGVPSPRADAALLAAHLLGTSPGRMRANAVTGARTPAGFEDLVAERASRVPLQHLTGRASFRQLELQVGPGVFVPRPETEQVAQRAIDALIEFGPGAVAVDLCTGSGAIAAALAQEVPQARIYAVELDPIACAWARRNLPDDVQLVQADAATALTELDGTVDVVVSNPPYVPPDAVPREVEVRDFDPPLALFGGGTDGLQVPRAVARRAAELLRPGGVLVMEHAESQAEAVRAILGATGRFAHICTTADLTGRPRMASARRTVA